MNDNFSNESEMLLSMARDLLKKDKKEPGDFSCSLTETGYCPLLNGAIHALSTNFKSANKALATD